MTDLMSGVAVTFLLIAAIFMVQAATQRKDAVRAQAKAETLAKQNVQASEELTYLRKLDKAGIEELANLKGRLEKDEKLRGKVELEYDPTKDPRLLTIVFSRENLQFALGECVVDPARRAGLAETLNAIFPQVCDTVSTGFVESIAVEGHTDSAPPYGGKCGMVASADDGTCFANPTLDACKHRSFENNVRLSAARAQYVFFEARDALKGDPRVATCLDRNFQIAGRGPMDPIDGNAWDAQRSEFENSKNRRVVIKVRVRAASVTRSSGP